MHHYRSAIQDPELLRQIQAFAAQEGIHGAEHHKYNVRVAGKKARGYEYVAGMLREDATLSPIQRLAATVALEHFTAMLASEFLSNPTYASRMDPKHAELWLWHAVEETEHKAVAFDVYSAVGGGYALRTTMMVRMTLGLILSAAYLMGDLLWQDRRDLRPAHAWSFVRWGFLSPGFFRKSSPRGSISSARASIPGRTTTRASSPRGRPRTPRRPRAPPTAGLRARAARAPLGARSPS